MSPLIAVARSSTVGPSPGGGSSPTTSSDDVSPLMVFASMCTRDPRRIPTVWSPDADCITTRPDVTEPRRWSPEAVWTVTDDDASCTSTSPEAERIVASPSMRSTRMSPDAVLIEASPPIEPRSTSPLALLMSTRPPRLPKRMSPDAAWARRPERAAAVHVGGGGRHLDVRAVRRTDAQDDLTVHEVEELEPLALHVDDELVPVAAGTHLDAGVVDHLAHLLAVARRVELDGRLCAVDGLNVDLTRGKAEVERQRSGRVERLGPHFAPPLRIGRRRERRGSRLSTRYSMCPNGVERKAISVPFMPGRTR